MGIDEGIIDDPMALKDEYSFALNVSERLRKLAESHPEWSTDDRNTIMFSAGYLLGQALLIKSISDDT